LRMVLRCSINRSFTRKLFRWNVAKVSIFVMPD
jgi:hypothetical protein